MELKDYIINKILDWYDRLFYVYYHTHDKVIGREKGSVMIARGFDILSGLIAWTLFFYMLARWIWGAESYYISAILAGLTGGVWGAGIHYLHKSYHNVRELNDKGWRKNRDSLIPLRNILFRKTIRNVIITIVEIIIILYH